MGDIFLPLQGPTGVTPKAPRVGAWQSPGYKGLTETEAFERYRTNGEWFGMRCDNYVVIDCDDKNAIRHWMSGPEAKARTTWTRKTPRGCHFVYLKMPDSPDAPAVDVWPGTDLRAGRTSQIVYWAPGYSDIYPPGDMVEFDASWLPGDFGKPKEVAEVEWDEMPWGVGNNTLTALAGVMRRQGMSMLLIAKCLGALNRITMPTDPMSIQEIVQIAKSVSRYDTHPDVDIEYEVDDADS